MSAGAGEERERGMESRGGATGGGHALLGWLSRSLNHNKEAITGFCGVTHISFIFVFPLSSLAPNHTAPEITANETTINTFKLNGMESVSVDTDISLEIVNSNKYYPIAFDPVELTFYFPASPDEPVGHGVLEGGVIPAGATTTRNLHAVFEAPWTLLGTFTEG